MLSKCMKVRVYDGDFVGWVNGMLVNHLGGERWTIFTEQGYSLDRYIKEEYLEMRKDGCGYVVSSICCPNCGSYDIEVYDDNPNEIVCYDCDNYWDIRE